MSIRRKAPALFAIAVFGALATAAPSAQAEPMFASTLSETTITSKPDGTGKTAHQVIDAAGASITCSTVSSQGTLSGKSASELRLSSVGYSTCNFIGQAATVNMNGCAFNYHANGQFDIACPAGKEMTFSAPNPPCDVVIPPQTGKGTVTYTNISGGTEITLSSSITELDYSASGLGCPETGAFTNGTYTTGNLILTGEKPGTEEMAGLSFSATGEPRFTFGESKTTLTSTPDGTGKTAHQVIDAAGASITCSELKSEAHVEGETASVIESWFDSYSTCNFIGQAATVNMNGCAFNYHANGQFDIACPAGKEMTFSAPNPVCDVVIPPQTGKGTVAYTNISGGTEITLSPSITELEYSASGLGCPETGAFTNGTYTTGNLILTGEKPGTEEMVAVGWES